MTRTQLSPLPSLIRFGLILLTLPPCAATEMGIYEAYPDQVTKPVFRKQDSRGSATPSQMEISRKSGEYRCEGGDAFLVERQYHGAINTGLLLHRHGRSYSMERNFSLSGLPRFESPGGALVWIDLPWKSTLLDGRSQKPLANDCVSTQEARPNISTSPL